MNDDVSPAARPPAGPPLPEITLDQRALDRLYPFHIRVDRDLRVAATGRVLARLLPRCAQRPRLDEVFAFERPVGVDGFEALAAAQDQSVLMAARELSDLVLKGEILVLAGGAHAVLLTVPWFRRPGQLEALDLRVSDFAIGDATPDLVFMVETQSALLEDAKALTERLKAARDQALRASRTKSEFLANMSHELRTPLNAIIGFSEYMTVLGADSIPQRFLGYLGDIHTSGHFLLELVNDLLDLSRIEMGKLAIENSRFDLSAAIGDIMRSVEPQAAQAGVELEFAQAGQPLWCRGDERLLRQVLLNLVTNAVKFNRAGGSVALSLAPAACGGATIAVADAGIGVDPAVIPALFEPFRQENSHIARKYGGTGLGLAIVKQLVELHQGRIEMESQPGVGAAVRVLLPRHRIVDAAETAQAGRAPAAVRVEAAA
jgi:signal transduction histidine kinase